MLSLFTLAFAFPFPSGWADALEVSDSEPVAACAEGVSESMRERFFGALQTRLAPRTNGLPLPDCSQDSMERARRAGAEFLLALSPESLAVWRLPGPWSEGGGRPTQLSSTAMEGPDGRLEWSRPRRERRLDGGALALTACQGRLYVAFRDHLLELAEDQRLELSPLRSSLRVRAGVARMTCSEEGLVIAHADFSRSGIVDLETFAWRDFGSGLRWTQSKGAWLVARSEAGTNRFSAELSILQGGRLRSRRWAPWLDAVGVDGDFLWLDTEGRLHRGETVLAEGLGRGLIAIPTTPPRILSSSVDSSDALLVLDDEGRTEDQLPIPGAIRDLSYDQGTVYVLTDQEDGSSEIWRVAVEGVP
ncbi:MAG: hypothetical protein AAF627_05515 [Myxococcota bacterium]